MKTKKPLAWLAAVSLLFSLVHLAAEETAVVKDGRINVRGQPSLIGEVITQLQEGEKVVVLEEITVAKPKTNEPPRWVRIQMPANTPVWVYAPFIDPATKTVKVSRLNLRAGPGENYSVVGRLTRGASIQEIRRVEDWLEIETPPGAYGFVAADLLAKPGSSPGPAATPEPAHLDSPVVRPPEIASTEPPAGRTVNQSPSAEAPAVATSPGSEPPPAQTAVPNVGLPPRDSTASSASPSASSPTTSEPARSPRAEPAPAPEMPAVTALPPQGEQALQRRVVRREGLVRSTASIQAPTYYELLSPETRKTMNYLHTENLGISLKDYRGRRIVVTGEEAIDPRWPKTPVIEVETLELIP